HPWRLIPIPPPLHLNRIAAIALNREPPPRLSIPNRHLSDGEFPECTPKQFFAVSYLGNCGGYRMPFFCGPGSVIFMPDHSTPPNLPASRARMKFFLMVILSGFFTAIGGVGIWFYWPTTPPGVPPVDPALVAMGRPIYQQNCASCHSANLEGQPNWKDLNPDGRFPAPPHDASGHTWHHTDGILLQIIEKGSAEFIGDGYESDMPGFRELLSDEEMKAVLEFIKSTWPEREREYQDVLNQREREVE
ncbi:Cytochrome c family protein, partial [hydrothermal vent metagenome]